MLTTYHIQSAEGDIAEDIHYGFPICMNFKLLCQYFSLFVKNFYKIMEDSEVEGWRQQFSAGFPFLTSAEKENKGANKSLLNYQFVQKEKNAWMFI